MVAKQCISDSHCHIRWASSTECLLPLSFCGTEKKNEDIFELRHVVLCGTHPDIDWADLSQLASLPSNRLPTVIESACPKPQTPQAVVGFGIHPWYVPECTEASTPTHSRRLNGPELLAAAEEKASTETPCCGAPAAVTQPRSIAELLRELEEHLQRHPLAIVGEIGLDKLRGPSEAAQRAAFEAQLRLAARYKRPVSLHCVRHYGLLLDVLAALSAEDTPPALIVHAFTGSLGIAQSLLRLKHKKGGVDQRGRPETVKVRDRIFFGVGAHTSLSVKTFAEQTLPFLCKEKRALLETDAHYVQSRNPSPAAVVQDTADISRQTVLFRIDKGAMSPLRTVAEAMEQYSPVGGNVLADAQEALERALSPVIH